MNTYGRTCIPIESIFHIIFETEPGIGYVYIIENEMNIKIGRTSNPQNRFRQLSNSNSGGLTPLRLFVSEPMYIDKTIEHLMHQKFADHRVEGEWFTDVEFDAVKDELIKLCTSEEFQTCNKVRKDYSEQYVNR